MHKNDAIKALRGSLRACIDKVQLSTIKPGDLVKILVKHMENDPNVLTYLGTINGRVYPAALPYEGTGTDDWMEADEERCGAECWGLFDCVDGVTRICAIIPENLESHETGFASDADALAFVRRCAPFSEFHRKALRLHNTVSQ